MHGPCPLGLFQLTPFPIRFELQRTVTDFDAKKIEESIESLDRKLRIQRRKKKYEKAMKLESKLLDLRRALEFSAGPQMEVQQRQGDDDMLSEEEETAAGRQLVARSYKMVENGVRFAVPRNGFQVINVRLIVHERSMPPSNAVDSALK